MCPIPYTDSFYHGDSAKRSFFEGWYFKHRQDDQVFCLIPGMSVSKNGRRSAFIQIIDNNGSFHIRYPFEEFFVDSNARLIRIGPNWFSESGMILDIVSPHFMAKGAVLYTGLRKLHPGVYAPSLMGPYSYLPFMECYHDILSLRHTVDGRLDWNGRKLVFHGGTGYIEKDWGKSFPKSWVWLHCENFSRYPEASAMLAVAFIPFLGRHFTGVLFVLDTKDKQYRLASYYGAKSSRIRQNNGKTTITVRQGSLTLEAYITQGKSHILYAPVAGYMGKSIKETPSCGCHLRLSQNGRIIWEDYGKNAGFEKTEPQELSSV